MNKRPLYFDYAATTPVDERVIKVMVECLGFTGNFGNPASSSHAFGQQARQSVEQARRQVAELVGANARRRSSGPPAPPNPTTSPSRAWPRPAAIAAATSSPARSNTRRFSIPPGNCRTPGVAVTYLVPDAEGLITAQAVSEAMRDDTFLVSLMLVNNELGTAQRHSGHRSDRARSRRVVPCRRGPGRGQSGDRSGAMAGGPDVVFGAQDSTAPRALARCTSARVRSSVCRRRFTAAVTRAVCVPGPWRRIRSSPWARPSRWRRHVFDEEKAAIVRLRERLLEPLAEHSRRSPQWQPDPAHSPYPEPDLQ